jgi:2-aminoadipate transaminase
VPIELTLARRAIRMSAPLHPETGSAIPFDSGYASPQAFPDLTELAQRALTAYRNESLQYGAPMGLPALRDAISSYMRDDGAAVSPDEILVVDGAKQGIDLICRLLTEEGDGVVVTAPTYFSAIPILCSFGLEFIEVTQDDEGIDVAMLAQLLQERQRNGMPEPKFIYNVPDFHNPTGITMSRRRREQLLDLAARRQIPIVEDSPYRKLRFEGTAEPSLKALDSNGLVFGLGTFSKLMCPGLRVGWICTTKELLERMARLKSDGGTCPLTQRIIAEFLQGGSLPGHLQRAQRIYSSHRDAMVAALRRELPGVEYIVPQGGYYLWLRFRDGVDTNVLAARAFERGVSVIGGNVFFAGGTDSYSAQHDLPKQYIRLAYSYAAPEQIDEGVKLLAAAYYSMR